LKSLRKDFKGKIVRPRKYKSASRALALYSRLWGQILHFRAAGVEIEDATIHHGFEENTEWLKLVKQNSKVKEEPATKHPLLKNVLGAFRKGFRKAKRKDPSMFTEKYYKMIVKSALKNPKEDNIAYWTLYRALKARRL